MRFTPHLCLTLLAASTVVLAGCASSGNMTANRKTELLNNQRQLASQSTAVLDRQSERPDAQRIPRALIRNARCIAVFPDVTKAALLLGGAHGRGLVSCRDRTGDFAAAPPASYNLTSGSLGLQAGATRADVIVLFQSDKAVQSLLNGRIELNGQIAATAGPSGWARSVGTGERAPIYVYSQGTSGLYAGINVQGGQIGANSDANTALYGPGTTPSSILLSSRPVPEVLGSFNDAIRRWAARASNDPRST